MMLWGELALLYHLLIFCKAFLIIQGEDFAQQYSYSF